MILPPLVFPGQTVQLIMQKIADNICMTLKTQVFVINVFLSLIMGAKCSAPGNLWPVKLAYLCQSEAAILWEESWLTFKG
jgi:hypothetical protein